MDRDAQNSGARPEQVKALRTVRQMDDLAGGLVLKHEDEMLDKFLNIFFESRDAQFPRLEAVQLEGELPVSVERLRRLSQLEEHGLCTKLKHSIFYHFDGEVKVLLLEAFKFMLRVHIDDIPRHNDDMPGVSHQIRTAQSVLEINLRSGLPMNGNVLASAMWHDLVEDHERLIMLETRRIIELLELKNDDGSDKIPSDISVTRLSLALLAEESNTVVGKMLTALTLNRSAVLQEMLGMHRDEARIKAEQLTDEEKNEAYWFYVMDIFTHPDPVIREGAGIVKGVDLVLENAATIGMLKRKYYQFRDKKTEEGDVKAEKIRNIFNRMQKKYKKVLEDFKSLLETWDEKTMLGSVKDDFTERIEKALKADYQQPIPAE